MTHLFPHQILDYAYLGDFVSSTNLNTLDFLICQKPIGQPPADSSQHFTEIIYFNDIGVVFKHNILFHHWALPTSYDADGTNTDTVRRRVGVSERRIRHREWMKAQSKRKREEKPVSAFLPSVKSIMAGPLQGVLERPSPFPSFVQSYSTLLPGLAGGQLVCGWRRTWELHPSEDLSELHRCFACIAMQKYHYRQMTSWRDSLPRLLLDERVSLGTFRFGACIDTGYSRAGGHGAFSASLSSVQEAHLLM